MVLVSPDVQLEQHMGRLHLFACDLALVALATFTALFLRDNFETTAEHVLALQPYLVVSLGAAAVIFPALRRPSRSLALRHSRRRARHCRRGGRHVDRRGGDRIQLQPTRRRAALAADRAGAARRRSARRRAARRALHVGHARAKARLAAPTPAGGPPRKTTLVIGLGRLTDLYLRCVDELAASRVRVAGILTENERQIGCFVRGVPVLGRPESVAETIRTLDIHGVSVGSIVVTTDFELLAPSVRDALTAIEREGRTRVERLPELLGLALYSELEDTPSCAREPRKRRCSRWTSRSSRRCRAGRSGAPSAPSTSASRARCSPPARR